MRRVPQQDSLLRLEVGEDACRIVDGDVIRCPRRSFQFVVGTEPDDAIDRRGPNVIHEVCRFERKASLILEAIPKEVG
jgi:hypothetical protein